MWLPHGVSKGHSRQVKPMECFRCFFIPYNDLVLPWGQQIQWKIIGDKAAVVIIQADMLRGKTEKEILGICKLALRRMEKDWGLSIVDDAVRDTFAEWLASEVQKEFSQGYQSKGYSFIFDQDSMEGMVGPDTWKAFLEHPEKFIKGKTRGTGMPPWVQAQQTEIQKRLKEEQRKDTPAIDVPDRVVVWSDEKTGKYYANLWVHLDAEGKEKEHKPIQLQQGEPPDKLMERIKQATQEAHIKYAEKKADTASREAPQWAQQLQQQLQSKLALLRKKEPGAKDFPDHLSLNVSTRQKPSYREFRLEVGSGETVRLQVWVNIPTTTGRFERVGGTLPFPLSPETKVDDLVPPVREAAATLRNRAPGSATEQDDAFGIPTGIEGIEGGTATHEAYPAEIVPLDLPQNGITVTGARNKFSMVLDFTAVHARNSPDHRLTLMQTFYFQWQVFNAARVKVDGKAEPVSWPARAAQLRKATEKPDEFFRNWGPFRPEDYPVITTVMDDRVRIPKKPGDYLVYCQATPKTKKGAKDKRASSEAFYPVRVREAQEVGTEEVTRGLRDIKDLRVLLAPWQR